MTHPRPARHRPRRWCLSAARRLRHPLPVSLQLQQGFSIGIAAAGPDPPDTLALTKTSFFPNVSLFSSFSHSKTVTLKITDDAPMSQRESEQRTHMFWLGVCNTHTSVENEQTFQYQHAMWRFRMPGRVSWKEIAGACHRRNGLAWFGSSSETSLADHRIISRTSPDSLPFSSRILYLKRQKTKTNPR